MPGKKPPPKGSAEEPKQDPDQRPRGPADKALEQAEQDVAEKRKEFEECQQKHEENEKRLKQIKELDIRIPDLEDKQKKAYMRFRRCLIPDRPDSANTRALTNATSIDPAAASRSVQPNPPNSIAEQRALQQLQQEAQDAILTLLATYYKKPRTRKELMLREQQREAAGNSERRSSKDNTPAVKPDPKKAKGKAGGDGVDEALLTGPDMELRCPIGIAPEVFEKVLKTRGDRMQYDEDLERCREEVKPLREATAQAKVEQVGKQQVARVKRQLQVLEQKLEECKAKVQHEDDEFRREREVEMWRATQRAQSAEDTGKGRPGSAKKK